MPRPRWVLPVVIAAILVTAGGIAYLVLDRKSHHSQPAASPGPPPPLTLSQQVQHVYIIMLENHAYDNFFGTYCTQVGPYCSNASVGLQPGVCMPYNLSNPGPCLAPYPFSVNQILEKDICHTWTCYHTSYNNGSMDGFLQASNNNTEAMGYYDNRTIPAFWQWAEQYAIGDNFFASAMSYTLPNHWRMIAAAAPNVTYYDGYSNFYTKGNLTANGTAYLDEANNTTTIIDELATHHLTWGYFDDHNLSFSGGITGYRDAIKNGQAWTYTDPMAAASRSYLNASYAASFGNSETLLGDIAEGQPPNVSWVMASKELSDHPPQNVENGMNWTMNLVDHIEKSSTWNSSVIFFTFDEPGGFYDGVVPPQVLAPYGLGFRVPFIVIGPYVRENLINSQLGYFESMMRFIEDVFHLPSLNSADANAPSLMPYFNFSAPARPPFIVNVSAGYPVPLQALPTVVAAHAIRAGEQGPARAAVTGGPPPLGPVIAFTTPSELRRPERLG